MHIGIDATGELVRGMHGESKANSVMRCLQSRAPEQKRAKLQMWHTYRKLHARGKLWRKAGKVQDVSLPHGPFAVPDLNVTPDDQVVNLQSLWRTYTRSCDAA